MKGIIGQISKEVAAYGVNLHKKCVTNLLRLLGSGPQRHSESYRLDDFHNLFLHVCLLVLYYRIQGRRRDSPVRGAGYEPFDSIAG